MKNFVFTRFASAVCFVVFAAYGFYQMRVNTVTPKGTSDLASTSLDFETPESCGPERNYLEKDLAQINPLFKNTRKDISSDAPPRSCATYIMKNFASLDARLAFRSQCVDKNGRQLSSPVRFHETERVNEGGQEVEKKIYFKSPCVTEDYVNSVYNSLIDVSECLNIPVKELLPKLYNESGLHINTLGPANDAGVGQLTLSALGGDVFEPLNDKYKDGDPNRTNQKSTFQYYIEEMTKSSKPSCQRILSQQNVVNLVPAGEILCDSKYAKTAKGKNECYPVWDISHRCDFISSPENPLRNVVTLGMLYRNNLLHSTGIKYVAGKDALGDTPYTAGMPYGGYFSKEKYVEKLQSLGVQHPKQEVLKTAILSLAFNAGLPAAKRFMTNYINDRVMLKVRTTDKDFDFLNTDVMKWSIFLRSKDFAKGWSGSKEDLKTVLDSFKVVAAMNINAESLQKRYLSERQAALAEIEKIKKSKSTDDAKNSAIAVQMARVEALRITFLGEFVNKSAIYLTFPEYLRIVHAYEAVKKGVGGSPGYLSWVANRYKELKEHTQGCVPDQFLQF